MTEINQILIAIVIIFTITALFLNADIFLFHKTISKKTEKKIVKLLTEYGYRYICESIYLLWNKKGKPLKMYFNNDSDNIQITVKKKYILEFRIEKTYNPPKNHVRARAETIKTLKNMKKFCESGIEGYFDLLDKNEELQQKLKKIENDFN
jgi:hypothetical protein